MGRYNNHRFGPPPIDRALRRWAAGAAVAAATLAVVTTSQGPGGLLAPVRDTVAGDAATRSRPQGRTESAGPPVLRTPEPAAPVGGKDRKDPKPSGPAPAPDGGRDPDDVRTLTSEAPKPKPEPEPEPKPEPEQDSGSAGGAEQPETGRTGLPGTRYYDWTQWIPGFDGLR